jgi:hypothetical protein
MPEQWRLHVQDTPTVIETSGGTERWALVGLVIMVGGFAVAFAVLAIVRPHELPGWLQPLRLAIIAVMALATAAAVWGIRRAWVMGLRIDDSGITIRNLLHTYRLGWHEVSHLQDGSGIPKQDTPTWALSVALLDGRSITAYGTWWSARTQEALERAARHYTIRSELTGAARPRNRRENLGGR